MEAGANMAAVRLLLLALCLGRAGGEEAYPTTTASATPQTDNSSVEVRGELRVRGGVRGVRD